MNENKEVFILMALDAIRKECKKHPDECGTCLFHTSNSFCGISDYNPDEWELNLDLDSKKYFK